jgi:outer membrane protein assembly factor BamD
MSPRIAAALLLLGPLAACSPRVSISGEVKYQKSAEDNYKAGLEEMKSESWPEAAKFLEHTRTKYPFSKYAALAELKLADVKMAQERFPEASEAYGSFVRLHPNHEEVDYAAFREGLALIKDGPSDFFAFPPAQERELKSVREGVQKLEGFLAKFLASRFRPEAQKERDRARTLLVEHEWYVASFYAQRNRWAGAAGRYERLVTAYPGSAREVEALFALSDAWSRLDDRFRARQALQQIIAKHPEDPRRPEAERRLADLR